MCLAIPLKIVERDGPDAKGEAGGLVRPIRLDFLPGAAVGDYVLVHAGFAIEKVDPEQARLDREAWEELEHALG